MMRGFPRLRAGTFIEAMLKNLLKARKTYFPAFGRGLSLRPYFVIWVTVKIAISPPSGGDFH